MAAAARVEPVAGEVWAYGNRFMVPLANGKGARLVPHEAVLHRGDIVLDGERDLHECGLPAGRWVVRMAEIVPLLARGKRIGQLPEEALSRVALAIRREREAREFERKHGRDGLQVAGFSMIENL